MRKIWHIINSARTIPSIVIFFVLRGHFGLMIAAAGAASYAVAYLLMAMTGNQLSRLDLGLILFWSAILTGAVLDPTRAEWFCNTNFTTLLYALFFLVVFVPQAFGAEPFTLPFARQKTAPELWRTEEFLVINQIMSVVWAALFLASFLISLAPSVWFKVVVPLALLIMIGIPFTRKFPAYYLGKSGKHFPSAGVLSLSAKARVTAPPIAADDDQTNRDEQRRECSQMNGPIRKALVISGSPRGKRGYTFQLLERFLAGMTSSGIEVELIDLAEKKIKPCLGCFNCWTKTPGRCGQRDDMPELLEKMNDADLIVYAQPLYVFSVPGLVKNFLDRSLPRLMPHLIERPDGSTRHPLRWREGRPERLVIFSVCGFPEIDHFKPMLALFRHLTKNSGGKIVGEILRPASESLLFHDHYAEKYERLLDQLFLAGQQLGEQGFVAKDTELAIAAPFFASLEKFRQVANRMWDFRIDYEARKMAGQALPGYREYLLNHPGMLLAGMASHYDPARAPGLAGILQFEISDREEGLYFFEFSPAGCTLTPGRAANNDLMIKSPWQVWQAISHGRISGQEAYQRGLYQVEGDLSILMKMRNAMV